MILHTLNASPTSAAFHDCVKIVRAGDAVILMGDGVYAALADSSACTILLSKDVELYVLGPDAEAAGVTIPAAGFRAIDMDGFVALTEKFPRQQAWY